MASGERAASEREVVATCQAPSAVSLSCRGRVFSEWFWLSRKFLVLEWLPKRSSVPILFRSFLWFSRVVTRVWVCVLGEMYAALISVRSRSGRCIWPGSARVFLCSIQGFIPLAIPLLTRVLRAISKREGDKGKLLIGQLNSFGTWWFHWCFSAIVFFCLRSDFLFFLSFSGIAKLHVVIYWLLRCIFSGKYDSKLSHFPW